MCQTLSELRVAVAALAQRFDPALVPPAQLAQVVGDAGAIEKMMATVAALAAARLARTGPGATAPREAARASGTSVLDAARALEAARQLEAQPEVAAAARAGALSRPQLGLVAGAVAVNSAAAPELLALAESGSLAELAEGAARARAAQLDLEARREGRRERPEAYAFDGLVALAGGGGGSSSPRAQVLFRVDYEAMLRGYPVDGEVCEVAGFGPVSTQAVLDTLDCGDPVLKAVVTKGHDVVTVAHLGRRPNAHQQTALDWLFPSCAAEGCGTRAAYLETDHRLEWAKSRSTVLGLLDRLCKFHHDRKTYEGWALVHGRGKRAFVPPDDPRHPGRARHPAEAPVGSLS